MNSVAKMAVDCSSDSDDDLYTHSIDIKKVRGVIVEPIASCADHRNGDSSISQKADPDIIPIDDDDSDSLTLSDPENIYPSKIKKSSRKRRERLEKEQLQELEKIMHEPMIVNISVPRKTRRTAKQVVDLCRSTDILNESLELLESTPKTPSTNNDLSQQEVAMDKEVELFVTVDADQEAGKPGRFMTIRRDEPFDKLRPVFAKELNCHQLDVLIHVNKVDAGPGDTPDSMGLDPKKLAVVNVFSLKSDSKYEEDLANDPSFIPVKCIFANGRPRCVYISLIEPFSEAKKRIAKELKLTKPIDKLVFDSEVLSDQHSPETVGMEADDVIEIHSKDSHL
ncbi:Ubiquitin domain-containing protein [Trichostrongylus colubriformis]|uniref:Ubiquitin domain-containing protein n=1 Tax=Trichostrongylus colubriformis TaxID=6319 RepID=A0AAN8FYC5_TRICO